MILDFIKKKKKNLWVYSSFCKHTSHSPYKECAAPNFSSAKPRLHLVNPPYPSKHICNDFCFLKLLVISISCDPFLF